MNNNKLINEIRAMLRVEARELYRGGLEAVRNNSLKLHQLVDLVTESESERVGLKTLQAGVAAIEQTLSQICAVVAEYNIRAANVERVLVAFEQPQKMLTIKRKQKQLANKTK